MVNRVVLVGRITKQPELRAAGNNNCCNFTLAVNRRFTSKDGNREADFINCVAWGPQANFMSSYVNKGALLAVEGRIQTRNYEDNTGKRVYVTEVVCESVQSLESRGVGQPKETIPVNENVGAPSDFKEEFNETPPLDISSDDLPFY